MKRVIAGIDLDLSVLWADLYFSYQCDKAKQHLSGSPLTWPNGGFLVFPLCPRLFILAYGASATTQVLTGLTVYTRDVVQLTTYVDAMEIHNIAGAFMLAVENGDSQTGVDRVKNALIELSGVTVVSPTKFTHKVGILGKSVQLQRSNQLYVRVKGTPGSKYKHTATMTNTAHDREDVQWQKVNN